MASMCDVPNKRPIEFKAKDHLSRKTCNGKATNIRKKSFVFQPNQNFACSGISSSILPLNQDFIEKMVTHSLKSDSLTDCNIFSFSFASSLIALKSAVLFNSKRDI